MIAANQFALNHMNPTNLKITALFAQMQTLFSFKGMANFGWMIRGASGRRVSQLTRFGKYTFVTIYVLGSLGCQRGELKENSPTSFRQGKVIGASMAPHFLGEHFQVQCEGCGGEVVADFEQSKTNESLICPFCGIPNSVSECRRQASDRVTIELDSNSLSRWDVVAFQLPSAQEAGVKRVVGLPGESIEIRDGNLWLEGGLIRKTIAEQKRTRILIHDSSKTNSETALWQAVDSNGVRLDRAEHRFESGDFVLDSKAASSELQWFEFCNQRNYARKTDLNSAGGEKILAWPIEDNYGYNQSLWRNLNVVDEIFVSLGFSTTGIRRVGWKYELGDRTYSFEIDVVGRELAITVLGDSAQKRIGQYALAEGIFGDPETEVEFSTIDRLAVVLIGGIEVAQFELEAPVRVLPKSEPMSARLFQIGAVGKAGVGEDRLLGRVRIWRDIYYSPSQENNGESQLLIGAPDGFLLLGDNQPVSIDSRHWPNASVPSEQLIGKVLK